MDDLIVHHVFGLLINRVDCLLTADPRGQGWYCRKAPVTPALVQAALLGHVSLGVYAVSEQGTSKWLALDVDTPAEVPALYRLAVKLAPQGNILLEQSRRGAHLWIFGPATPWAQVHAYGIHLAREAGLGQVEVFPKGEGLNGLKLPGMRHPKSGRVYPAINPLTGEVLDARRALVAIRPQPFPAVELRREWSAAPRETTATGDFWDLVQELAKLTRLRVFGPEKAIGQCPWHDDQHPSLFVKGQRFHCLASSCGCWGDVADVRRFTEQGIVPPR